MTAPLLPIDALDGYTVTRTGHVFTLTPTERPTMPDIRQTMTSACEEVMHRRLVNLAMSLDDDLLDVFTDDDLVDHALTGLRPDMRVPAPADCYGCCGTGYYQGFGTRPGTPCLHHGPECEPGACRAPCEVLYEQEAEWVDATDLRRMSPDEAAREAAYQAETEQYATRAEWRER